MILILLGAPGAGKGTQGEKIVAEFGMPGISTGDLLREEVKAGSALGKKAKGYMDKGELVPDELIVAMLGDRILKEDCKNGFILDGFPRTVPQAETLAGLLAGKDRKLNAVVNVHVDKEAIVQRLSNRISCAICKAGFNLISKPPKQKGICDACGGNLIQRDDDKEATIRNRLSVYEQKTSPLIEYYGKKGLLHNFDGNRSVDTIYGEIRSKLQALRG